MKKVPKYNFRSLEKKWQKKWQAEKLYQPNMNKAKKPFYNLMMFPYPSAEGLHVGNMYAFTGVDVYGRYKKLQGYDVFEPIGLDGFGIHSENYAIKIGQHISDVSKRSEKNFYRQLHEIGNMYDWSRTVETYKPNYYKWTQWIFLKMYEKGLAYRKQAKINWCPSCKTVLSDEQVIAGQCERCDSMVTKKELQQWFFKITAYADRLLKNLDWIDWPQDVKTNQRNWIGKSEGAKIKFPIGDYKAQNHIEVFTTRPDTLFGATYLVLAPEHPLIKNEELGIKNYDEVRAYVETVAKKSEQDRKDETKEKNGLELKGLKAINPATNEEIPVWVADYVLGGYGTGAIMAVPAHDERDFEFAKKYGLKMQKVVDPIKNFIVVITSSLKKPFFDQASNFSKIITGSGQTEGLSFIYTNEIDRVFELAKSNFTDDCWYIHSEGTIKKILIHSKTNENKIFDWSSKEQLKKAYNFGLKVGIKKEQLDFNDIYAAFTDEGVAVNSGFLTGLKTNDAKKEMIKWLEKNKFGKKSVDYKLRDWCISRQRYWGPPIPIIYCEKCGVQPVAEKDLPVKLPPMKDFLPEGTGKGPLAKNENFVDAKCPVCGGPAKRETDVSDPFVDSAWYFFRYPSTEFGNKPFDRKRTRKWMPVDSYIGGKEHTVLHLLYSRFVTMVFKDLDLIDFEEPYKRFFGHGLITKDGAKMSKSKGNVVNPDEMIAKYGADSVRLYLRFLGDFSQGGDWRDTGVEGMHRFVLRLWKLFYSLEGNGQGLKKTTMIDRTIKVVGEDIDRLSFNTAVARIMEFVNWIKENETLFNQKQVKKIKETLAFLIAPMAPHLAEEFWASLGNKTSIFTQRWPKYKANNIVQDEIEIVVQVNGKVRDRIAMSKDITEEAAQKAALESQRVKQHVKGKQIKKVIYIPGRLVSIVAA